MEVMHFAFCMLAVIPGNSLVVEALAEGKETVANTAIEEPVRLTKR